MPPRREPDPDLTTPSWLDGRLAVSGERLELSAHVPGVFETLRCERGELRFESAHLARMARGAALLALPWPPPWDPSAALRELARAAALPVLALRITWQPPHLALAARAILAPPAEVVVLVDAPGGTALPQPAGAKTTLRAGYDVLRSAARARGAFEALVQDADGQLVEGTVTNLFVARDGELATPPLARGALPGVVRGALLADLGRAPVRDCAGRLWHVRERELWTFELARAEELLLTNALIRVVGADRLVAAGPERPGSADERPVRAGLPGSAGPLARTLLERIVRLESG